jgi:hypothetical protein
VKKVAAVDAQPVAAQLPVGAKQEMKLENAMFEFVKDTAAYQTEVRHVFFVLAAPRITALWSARKLQRNLTHVLFLRGTVAESRVAGAKDRPEDTVAGRRVPPASGS